MVIRSDGRRVQTIRNNFPISQYNADRIMHSRHERFVYPRAAYAQVRGDIRLREKKIPPYTFARRLSVGNALVMYRKETGKKRKEWKV